MNRAVVVAIEPAVDNRFSARVDELWRSLRGVHGGIVAALAVRATEHVLHDERIDPATTLRAGHIRLNPRQHHR